MSDKSIMPMDSRGKYHGYCEQYYDHGELFWKGVRIHGKNYGYFKCYSPSGNLDGVHTGYYLEADRISGDNIEGYCYIWNRVAV